MAKLGKYRVTLTLVVSATSPEDAVDEFCNICWSDGPTFKVEPIDGDTVYIGGDVADGPAIYGDEE